MTRPISPPPPRARDPYGIGPVGSLVGPALSILGLVLIGILTLNLFNYDVPFVSNGGNGPQGPVGADRTPAPSNVIVVPPEAAFEGSIVYAKQGNIWIQQDKDVKQLTDGGRDSMPSWSPDGQSIVFIRTHDEDGYWPVRGRNGHYALSVPDIMQVQADGSAKPVRLFSGQVKHGRLRWSAWIRQPVLSPDGTTIALVTDAPSPDNSNVVLQFYNLAKKRLTRAGVREIQVLGHQDPEWRSDGKYLLYTQNGRDGARGAPVIERYEVATKKARAITATGYMQASYSPDGHYMAATRTTALGTDVAILDANTGHELMRVTNDDASWAPSWSPAGDGIAFLHIVGQTVDLRLAKLDGAPGAWTIKETIDLTEVSGLDAASRPDWFIPPALLPAVPTPPPGPASDAPSAAPSGASPSQ
jgi:Tol biopolymer transport system component